MELPVIKVSVTSTHQHLSQIPSGIQNLSFPSRKRATSEFKRRLKQTHLSSNHSNLSEVSSKIISSTPTGKQKLLKHRQNLSNRVKKVFAPVRQISVSDPLSISSTPQSISENAPKYNFPIRSIKHLSNIRLKSETPTNFSNNIPYRLEKYRKTIKELLVSPVKKNSPFRPFSRFKQEVSVIKHARFSHKLNLKPEIQGDLQPVVFSVL